MNLLEIENVSKSYKNHNALNNISLSIPSGSIFGLLGPNGAGKTTLIRIINKIIEQDSGTVKLNGCNMDMKQIQKIGYLPEERGLYKKMKVGEQLLYLSQLKGLKRIDAITKIKYWLEKLEIKDWVNAKVEDLSKGMAQKIQFIATVLHDPPLIILDEPFSGFDPVNAELIKDEILDLRKNGTTVIFSTHRMESVEELCDYIAMINKANKILDGKKTDIKNLYRNGVYEVVHSHQLISTEYYQIIKSENIENELIKSTIKSDSKDPNMVIKLLIQESIIHSFVEKIPSINEIFIENIKSTSHA